MHCIRSCYRVCSEIDTRGTYTVVAISALLNILTPELADGVADFLLRSVVFWKVLFELICTLPQLSELRGWVWGGAR
jgi:hypothetical protein